MIIYSLFIKIITGVLMRLPCELNGLFFFSFNEKARVVALKEMSVIFIKAEVQLSFKSCL